MPQILNKRIFLKPGDIVDIVAPSAKCHFTVLEKVCALVESWGLKCRIPGDLFGASLLYANSDEKRLFHLYNALSDHESKLIWCLLGGFGSTKIIPMLSKLKPLDQNKLFLGFSDITALHIFLQGQWGWSTIHGPNAHQITLNKISNHSVELLKKMLFSKEVIYFYEPITPLNSMAQNNISITGPIVGGNLHIIQASLGTSWLINADKKILFIEEVRERAYRIDRVLDHLSQAGVLDGVKAILLGDFIDDGEPNGQFLVNQTLKQFATQCPLPIFQIKDIGHGFTNNPLALGTPVTINAGNEPSLEWRF